MLVLAASVDFSNPILWAILIGWILSVVLHEFGHGIVAYWGGDYTIAERGGLTLNPLQYIDPVMSIILPAVFLLMGGIPLPGGVTYIRRDLIRSTAWNVAVSAAGPATNLILFLAFALPLHPRIGWVDPIAGPANWNNLQLFCGAMAVLQMLAALLNLIPIPPLDGFQMISPFLPVELRGKLAQPQVTMALFVVLFLVMVNSPLPFRAMQHVFVRTLIALGFDPFSIAAVWDAYRVAMFGVTP
jgi:Zn-dependent protease